MTEDALDRARAHAGDWIAGFDDRPVATTVTADALRHRLARPLGDDGVAPAAVIDALVEDTAGGLLGSGSGRFFAWVIGGALESALAADWLVAAWDQNGPLHASGPALAVAEEVAGGWIKELLDLPREASFAFTTGCQLAHLTGLAAARHALLEAAGWDVEVQGLNAAPAIRVITNTEKHESVDRAVRFLGLGSRSIVRAPTAQDGRITAAGLAAALADANGRAIVVLNAADLNIGACDDFAALIPMAHEAGAWVHVDGAFGLFARASRSKRHLVAGIEMADSWATDAHKWLNVPFDCGIVIVRNREAHRAAMTISTSYMAPATDGRDPIDWTPEWSRRARGVPVYAALRELGRHGVERLVDRCCDHCRTLVTKVGALPGAEILAAPTLNQGLVRFSRAGATLQEDDRYTNQVIDAVNASGEAFFAATTWRERRAMRVSVVNWRTSERDIDRAVAAIDAALR